LQVDCLDVISDCECDNLFFDWGQATSPLNPAYTATIAVSDANVAQALTFLQTQKGNGQPLAVKINANATLKRQHDQHHLQ